MLKKKCKALNIEWCDCEYTSWKRAGAQLEGLSPFNDERTPSFMVSPESRFKHLIFLSGKGGDIFAICDDGGRNRFSSITGAFTSKYGRWSDLFNGDGRRAAVAPGLGRQTGCQFLSAEFANVSLNHVVKNLSD